MANLYEITATIESLLARAIGPGGEVLDEQLNAELDALESDRDKRVLHVAAAIVDYRAEAAKIKERAKVLAEWARVEEAKADRLERYIAANIPEGHKVSDDRVRVSWRRSERVVIDEQYAENCPPQFVRVKYEHATSEIREALKSGDPEVAKIAHLETRMNLQVK